MLIPLLALLTHKTNAVNTIFETVTVTENACPTLAPTLIKDVGSFCFNSSTSTVCSNTIMGSIPASDKMPFVYIISPSNGMELSVGAALQIVLDVKNLDLIQYDNQISLFSQPQELNPQSGFLKGNIGVSVQYLGENIHSIDTPKADSAKFFPEKGEFKIDGLTEPGIYRLCTIVSAPTFQSFALPVAKRGSLNDCIRFTLLP